MPAIAATERSRPPAMMSGVPAAAIRPMKATLPPIVSMLLIDRKNGERIEKATIMREIKAEQHRNARPGLGQPERRLRARPRDLAARHQPAARRIVKKGSSRLQSLQLRENAGSLAVAAINCAGWAPFSNRPATRPRSSTIERSERPATSSTSEDSTRTAKPRSASWRSFA